MVKSYQAEMSAYISQTKAVIALDSNGILNLQYLRLYGCDPLQDLWCTDKTNKPAKDNHANHHP
jgi:hypothetical protein